MTIHAVDRAKIALAAVAAVSFGWGIRADQPVARWIGLGCLIAAVLLRFVPRAPRV